MSEHTAQFEPITGRHQGRSGFRRRSPGGSSALQRVIAFIGASRNPGDSFGDQGQKPAGVRRSHPFCDVGSDGISRWSPRPCSRNATAATRPDSASGSLLRVDRNPAPLLGCDVMQGLGERPAMSGGVADGALTLSV